MQKIAQQFFRGAPVSVAITALCALVYAVMAVQSRSLDSVVSVSYTHLTLPTKRIV